MNYTSMANNSTVVYPMCSTKITTGIYLDKANDQVFQSIFLPSFIFTLFMFLIGGPGNALVFYIYFSKWRKTTARIFILALAGFDLMNCFFTMPMELTVLHNIITFDHNPVCKIFRYITFMMNHGSSVVLAAIAIDRYIRICYPLRPQLRPHHAKKVVILALILSVTFAWPALFIYGSQTVPIPIPGKTHMCIIGKTCLYEDKFIQTSYPLIFSLSLLVGNVIIDLAMIILYSMIGYQVIQRGTSVNPTPLKYRKGSTSTLSTDDNCLGDKRTEEQERLARNSPENVQNENNEKQVYSVSEKNTHKLTKQSSASIRRDMFRQRSLSISSIEARKSQMYKTTLMLFMVTIVFMGSFVPYCVIVIIRALDKSYYNELSTAGKAVYNLFLRNYMLSSSLNPIIYCFLSIQFRQQCKDLFKRIKKALH
ncbi:gonadotropin-releasing hormone receptor-like [Mytilus californianus]|uniref:gonadotropin-releasing hormone receptor-like n=1 Tax=Mytilus californianus TaxID=6549 RepID=UPI002245B695|nr:gonadotropin-releasing hormone receptor-like [Mytilus californianus]